MDIKDIKLGTAEKKRKIYEPKDCHVLSAKIVSKTGNKDILELELKHPDEEMHLTVRKAKYFTSKDKLESKGMWVSLDEEGNVSKYSGLGKVLAFYKCNNLQDLIGKTVHTAHNDEQYLVIKAYD